MNGRILTAKPTIGWLLGIIVLTLTVACSGGDSDKPDPASGRDLTIDAGSAAETSEGQAVTSNVDTTEITSTPDSDQSSLAIGSSAWWNSKAPVADFRAIFPVLANSPDGDAIWSLYAATFVTSEWLSGREPVPEAFGPYVADTTLEELPVEANNSFSQVMALEPTSAEWLRPYQFADTDEEFTLVVNLGFSACLSNATWGECFARASNAGSSGAGESVSTPANSATETAPPVADGQSGSDIGSNAWWNAIAPVSDFRAIIPVLANTPNGDAFWSLYAVSFVTSEWISGRVPDPTNFGEYVAGLALENLPAEANDLFGQVLALDPTSADWLRPYQFADTDEEFTLIANLGFTSCLSTTTWADCIARALGR